MIINNIIITITTLLLLKIFSMLVVLIFTIIYKIKAKGETDKELSYIEKQTNVSPLSFILYIIVNINTTSMENNFNNNNVVIVIIILFIIIFS